MNLGDADYNGLQTQIRYRGTRLDASLSYTLSKATDNSTDFQSAFVVQDTGKGRDRNNPYGLPVGFNPDGEKATSLQDQRHRFVLSGYSRVWAGIQASWIFTAASGAAGGAFGAAGLAIELPADLAGSLDNAGIHVQFCGVAEASPGVDQAKR